ncbi:alpha/beta fold hydrolase [Bacillus atrophaeus]|uniref:alpha/beta fold hydrolase n=1 Tax=Bacillus atrophaeus TaxID=1452 RepID=UPI00032D75A7|nr:alpha/beta fold hydrolase [Bacillus atrophaeus]AKL85065.1 YqjL [Bacillus atrophaeus UCMB-5137]WFE12767.1 alpha/beta fold hydrolase [Bacillus atrophaeus]
MNTAMEEKTYTVDGCPFHTKHRKGTSDVTVVFEAGYGTSSETWNPLLANIDEELGIFTYDRAGLGKSGRSAHSRTADRMVKELKALLHRAGVKPPYLVVSHSYGAIISRLWASQNRRDIIGMVLLDPASEDQENNVLPFMPEDMQAAYYRQFILEGSHAEFLTSLRQIKKQQIHLGDMPLLILSSGERNERLKKAHKEWQKLHSSILSLSNQSGWIQAENSSHDIHHDEPHIVHLALYDVWCAARQQMGAPVYQAVN